MQITRLVPSTTVADAPSGGIEQRRRERVAVEIDNRILKHTSLFTDTTLSEYCPAEARYWLK